MGLLYRIVYLQRNKKRREPKGEKMSRLKKKNRNNKDFFGLVLQVSKVRVNKHTPINQSYTVSNNITVAVCRTTDKCWSEIACKA